MINEEIPSTIVTVSVTVVPDPTSEDGVTIQCEPDPVQVGVCDTLISFKLDTAGYRFKKENAIVLKEESTDFPYDSWTISHTHAALLDKCDIKGETFGYYVHLIRDSDKKEISVDPFIKNTGTTTDC
jgi:hypothetical protein